MRLNIILPFIALSLVAAPAFAQNPILDRAKENAARRAQNKAFREAEHPEENNATAAPAAATPAATTTAAAAPAAPATSEAAPAPAMPATPAAPATAPAPAAPATPAAP